MARWAKVQDLKTNEKRSVFEIFRAKSFPIEVRHHLALWIENNINPTLQPSPHRIAEIHEEFIQEIQKAVAFQQQESDFFIDVKLKEAAQDFQVRSQIFHFSVLTLTCGTLKIAVCKPFNMNANISFFLFFF
jgi:hypothetical protein